MVQMTYCVVWSPDDGRVSPSDVCALIMAKTAGARMFENTGVTAFDGSRTIKGVEQTSNNQLHIALCAGFGRVTLAMAGANVPALACEHFYLLTKPIEGIEGNIPTLSDHDSHLISAMTVACWFGCFADGQATQAWSFGSNLAFGLLQEDWPPLTHDDERHRLPALETAEVKMLLNDLELYTRWHLYVG